MNFRYLVKKLFTESALYALGPTLQSAVSFFLLPLYTSYLSTSDYGELEFVLAVAAFLNPLIDSGLTSSFWKFGVGKKACVREKVLSNILFSKMIISGIVALILFFLSFEIGGRSLELISLYMIVLFSQAILRTIYLEYQSTHRATLYVVISFIVALVTALANIMFIAQLGMGVKGVIYGNIVGIIFALVIFFPTYQKIIRIYWDINLVKELFSYGFPLVFGNLAYLITSTSDRFFLNIFASASDLGLYGYGNKFATLLNILIIAPFFLGFNPIRWEVYGHADAKETFARLYSLVFTILIICYFWFSFIGGFLGLRITSNPEFIPGVRAIPLRALSYFLYGLYYFRSMGLLFEKKTVLISVVTVIAAVVNILCNLFLVPRYSYIGAAISSVLSYLVMFIVCSRLSQRYYPIKVNRKLEVGGILLTLVNCVLTLLIGNKNIELIFLPSMMFGIIVGFMAFYQNRRKIFPLFNHFIEMILKKA